MIPQPRTLNPWSPNATLESYKSWSPDPLERPTPCGVQILGWNECFEPFTSNLYARRVLSGEFTVVNQHLLADLTDLGLWDSTMKNMLIAHNGSVQNLPQARRRRHPRAAAALAPPPAGLAEAEGRHS